MRVGQPWLVPLLYNVLVETGHADPDFYLKPLSFILDPETNSQKLFPPFTWFTSQFCV